MSNLKRFMKSSAIYFVGNVLTKIISFFLLPIYTGHILPKDMGYYDLSLSYLNILVPIICMEIWSGIMRFMFDYNQEDGKYKVIFNGMSLFVISLGLYFVAYIGLFIFADIQYLTLIFFYGLITMLQNVYSYIARGLGYNTVFAVSGIVGSLVNSVSNIFMILVLNMTLSSLYIAMIVGLLVQVIILECKVHLLSHMSFKLYNKDIIKQLIRFSLPLCLNSASYWFLNGYNRVGISNLLGLDANGFYSVAGKFTFVLTLVSTCFSMAWQELAYSKGNEKNKSEFYTIAANYYIKFLSLGCLLFIPAISIIYPYFISNEYADAFSLVPVYVFATGVSIFSGFLGNIFSAEKQNGILFISTMVAAAVNVLLFHLLVGKIGIQAANIALLVGFLVNVIIRLKLLKRESHIVLNMPFLLVTMCLFAIALYIYLYGGLVANILFFVAIMVFAVYIFRDLLQMVVRMLKERQSKKS